MEALNTLENNKLISLKIVLFFSFFDFPFLALYHLYTASSEKLFPYCHISFDKFTLNPIQRVSLYNQIMNRLCEN